jgi:hypothetical protein
MNRLPVSPLISRGLEIAEKHLGPKRLSEMLGSPAATIVAWRSGHADMPHAKFLLLVDILTKIDPHWMDAPK